jgi:hypothetical protein
MCVAISSASVQAAQALRRSEFFAAKALLKR